ncbi:hypothetical protein LCGC14_0995330 [marine sediment metagenome]|uniref:Uncharacterized protein n=1 Tax=marine sediment metagenome TaxID=412755 RepID=A0A0F9N4N1_9ZZZZ
MAHRKKSRVLFDLNGKEYTTSTSDIPRFDWQMLYKTLLHAKGLVEGRTELALDFALSSGRDTIHKILWDLLVLLEEEISNKTARQVILWVIACYGYTHGLSTSREEFKTWPHPTYPFKRNRVKFYDWREDMKCPLCLRRFIPPKNYKRKEPLLRKFKLWLANHLETEYH